MFVSAVRSVVEPLFALLCVLRPVVACRRIRRQRFSVQSFTGVLRATGC